eukprot:scaffold10660_cov107-Isochrysis_galbana.AAC.2
MSSLFNPTGPAVGTYIGQIWPRAGVRVQGQSGGVKRGSAGGETQEVKRLRCRSRAASTSEEARDKN